MWDIVRERFEQPEAGSEAVSVSLSWPEFSAKDRDRAVKKKEKGRLRICRRDSRGCKPGQES